MSRSVAKKKVHIWFQEYKKDKICKKCGENRYYCLEFHHKNNNEKKYNVSLAAKRGYSINNILKEIEKCIVLCKNCHAEFHHMYDGENNTEEQVNEFLKK